jgi:hypothetical protein
MGYESFDKGAAEKFVLDPHGVCHRAPESESAAK